MLTIGAPLAMGMTRQQLHSVLAHELGHYSHRHMALSPAVYRGQAALGLIVRDLGPRSVLGRLFAGYARLYFRLTSAITRQQELAADRWSARVAGPRVAASAMRELPALGASWQFFLDEYAFPVPGARPDALLDGFANLLASPQRQQEMHELRREPPEPPEDPYDSHLGQRLAVA